MYIKIKGLEPIHQKSKENKSTRRHNPKKKPKETMNKFMKKKT